jgi:hypothetical protein
MAISGTYYIDTADFSTATAVWTNTSLTTKAPDGYYSFGGNYRQQFEGLLLPIESCSTPPIDCFNYEMVGTSDGPGCVGYVNYSYTDCNGVLQIGASFSTSVTEYVCAQSTPTITCGSASITNLGACLA